MIKMRVLLMVGADCPPLEAGQRDVERHISECGNCQAADAAHFLNTLGVVPKIIFTSPFVRIKETGNCLSERLSGGCQVEVVSALMPGAGPDELMRAITQRSGDCTIEEWIAVIIHESDANFIFRSLMGQDYSLPVYAGMVSGMDITCDHAQICGKLLFLRYPGEI